MASRLPSEQWFPAGEPRISSRHLRLRSGLGVRVVEAGPATGPPVFLVHGWACSVFSFRHTIPALADAGYHVLSADLKGHGQSDKPLGPGQYRTDAFVTNVLETLDALGVERTALVGHSMGAAIAVRVALAQPDRVERLALLSPVGLGQVRLVCLARPFPRGLGRILPPLAMRWLFALALRLAYGPREAVSKRAVDEYWAPTADSSFVRALWAMLHDMEWDPLVESDLRAVRQPTLVLRGARDLLIASGALAFGETVVVPDGGHALPESNPVETNRELLRFLGAVARSGTMG